MATFLGAPIRNESNARYKRVHVVPLEMTVTGKWELDHSLTGDMRDLMREIGQSSFVIWAIGKADETVRFLHYTGQIKGRDFHVFDMNGFMRLQGAVKKASAFAKLTGVSALAKAAGVKIEFDTVKYNHSLLADGKRKAHKPDEKRLGNTESLTYWTNKNGFDGIMVEWHLMDRGGLLLTAFHYVDANDRLNVVMSCNDKSVTKVFNRRQFDDNDRKHIEKMNATMSAKGLSINR